MHNVAPSRALARRTRQLLTLAFVIATIAILTIVIGIALFVVPLAAPASPYYRTYNLVRWAVTIIGVIIFLISLGVGVRAVTIRKDNDLAVIVGRFLGQYLDERYHFIRNVNKREIGYVDAVLIGPPGALVFRILDSSGNFANEGADWLKQDGRGHWTVAGIDPTRECVQDIKRLREYLTQNNLGDVPVYGVVVFTRREPAVQLAAKQPVVPITTLPSLVTNLGGNYLAKERMDPAKAAAVVRLVYET